MSTDAIYYHYIPQLNQKLINNLFKFSCRNISPSSSILISQRAIERPKVSCCLIYMSAYQLMLGIDACRWRRHVLLLHVQLCINAFHIFKHTEPRDAFLHRKCRICARLHGIVKRWSSACYKGLSFLLWLYTATSILKLSIRLCLFHFVRHQISRFFSSPRQIKMALSKIFRRALLQSE